MASGEIVGYAVYPAPPDASQAAPSSRAGGSTPGELVPTLKFDDAAIEYWDFYFRLENYAGGGLTITFDWSADTATTNETRWGAAIRRIQDDAEDVDTSHTYDFNDVDDTAPSASGRAVPCVDHVHRRRGHGLHRRRRGGDPAHPPQRHACQ